MTLDVEFVALLRCPETGGKVAPATKELLAKLNTEQATGRLVSRSGQPVAALLEAGLVREDGAVFYPIRDGIPLMVVDEGIAVPT